MERDREGRFLPGLHYSPKTEFRSENLLREKHPLWNGGKYRRNGYVMVLSPNHPNANSDGYVREHRIVMEEFLGRYLNKSEKIHHKNGNKSDNRIENLELCSSDAEHFRNHRKYRHFNASNVPSPTHLGEKIVVEYPKNVRKVASLCPTCGKIFWKMDGTKRIKGFCSKSCGRKSAIYSITNSEHNLRSFWSDGRVGELSETSESNRDTNSIRNTTFSSKP